MPAVLTAREEEIIRTVAYYRYMTARDLTNLLFAKTSITWMRGLLAELSGKDDLQTHHYLCRFTLPSHGGNEGAGLCVGRQGQAAFARARDTGLVVFPAKPTQILKLQLRHSQSHPHPHHDRRRMWAKDHPTYFLTEKRICYELIGQGGA